MKHDTQDDSRNNAKRNLTNTLTREEKSIVTAARTLYDVIQYDCESVYVQSAWSAFEDAIRAASGTRSVLVQCEMLEPDVAEWKFLLAYVLRRGWKIHDHGEFGYLTHDKSPILFTITRDYPDSLDWNPPSAAMFAEIVKETKRVR